MAKAQLFSMKVSEQKFSESISRSSTASSQVFFLGFSFMYFFSMQKKKPLHSLMQPPSFLTVWTVVNGTKQFNTTVCNALI